MEIICALSSQGRESTLEQLEAHVKPEYFTNKRAWLEWILTKVSGEICDSSISVEIRGMDTRSGNPEHVYLTVSDFVFEKISE